MNDTRFRRVFASTVSGYALIAGNIGYTILSIPLALNYLSREQFGLWALSSQISGYLTMIDLGMTSSLARMLVDCKDNRGGTAYGSMVVTGIWVLVCQSIVILIAGLVFSLFSANIFKISDQLSQEFIWLMAGQVLLTALAFLTRLFGLMLYAFQRVDIQNFASSGQFFLNFFVLWAGFHSGWGVFSLLAAGVAGWVVSTVVSAIACRRLGCWPTATEWGPASRQNFRAMSSYGADIFLIALGSQLITSSQTVLVSRILGVDAAALWAIMTKTFTMAGQVVWRLFSNATPVLAEMQVRGEMITLRKRYHDLYIFISLLSGFVAVMFAVCNGPFAAVWTKGKMSWPEINNWLLGGWMILLTLQTCHNTLISSMKLIGKMKYIYIVEGALFVAVASLVMPHYGLTGMIFCSLLATICFTLSYGCWRLRRILQVDATELTVHWNLPLLKFLAAMAIPVGAIIWWQQSLSPLTSLLIGLAGVGLIGTIVFVGLCLPQSIRNEFAERLGIPFLKRFHF